MRPPHRDKTLKGTTFVAVVASVCLLVFALHRLVQTEAEIAGHFGESLLWALYQAQHDEQRLIVGIYEWNNGRRTAEDAERLRLLLDVAISRFDVFSHGTLAKAPSVAGQGSVVEAARANLSDFDRIVAEAIPQRLELPREAVETLNSNVSKLRIVANRVLLAERNAIAAQRDRYSAVLWQAIVALLLILACIALIVGRLLSSLRSVAIARDALRRDRDFSNLLLQSSGDGVVAFDLEGRCTHCNSAMGGIFPAPGGAAVIGHRIQDVYGLPDGHTIVNMMLGTLAGQSLHMAAHALPSGERYVEKFTYPIWSDNAVVGGILSIRDVTDAHLARLQLVEHRDQLEETVQERTKDLEDSLERETKLRELYKGFVSMVSHQFRTPLSIVDSSAQRMIRRGREMSEEEIRERAGKIRTAILRLTRLVSSTLNAAKLDAGEIDFAPRHCDLGKLIAEACEREKETAPDRQFSMELDDLPDQVWCDPLLIDHTIANLLSNAVKYSAAQEPIRITATVAGKWLHIEVCDKGVGIPEDEQGKLFERFFRARTAVGIEGTGIGLNVVRTIARMHGGDVDVRSREGGGSTFILRLPIDEKSAE